jgi:hypothetical protein
MGGKVKTENYQLRVTDNNCLWFSLKSAIAFPQDLWCKNKFIFFKTT